ncbi:GNAT family N-acetyltransferase [Danxiaibacter flavus]|uniref:GNAT family N-acetyltransferase n=1 Tax=Danxiaibacter flavus TaxID=3049108 RepID=A0ABV3ZD27_9BACT|nr:GNAT family N-acetyltransferase [Chitinophagaceae bacterium DXS]
MNIIIIESRPSDQPDLRMLFLKERQKTFAWKDAASFHPDDFDKETEGETILVALCDNRLVGFISIWLPDNFIHHLFVDSAYQNLGIGGKLLEKAIEKTGLPVSLKCLELNTKAVAFYTGKGFTEKAKGGEGEESYILFELDQKV